MDRIQELFSLDGLQIVITGASSGLGLNQAILLAECGARVVALSRTGEAKVDLRKELPNSLVFDRMDVTNELEVEEKMKAIGESGGIDVLINNAGITMRKSVQEIADEEWRKIHDVNINGIFYCCKHAFPFLSKSKHIGRVINISSMASYLGFSEVVPYSSSKAAVLGITRGLAVEWRNQNILVNSVSPGWFPSLMSQQVMDDDRREKILNKIPLGRFGKPEELSSVIGFLASSAATYINGQDFSVDGGALAFGY
ncbi:SDR family oxidoreductase [uncultured Sunxiuqinia sp.]|uniref:SDR family NAD(P)-dependent oxidoreductase n=1 Tax=uncultured Sunxiuqinia sp. TaxID=1573825 RepID=UPI002AA66225|nr:SDR family oxidoreductase [uncultured Sunxiuqinia sp.]